MKLCAMNPRPYTKHPPADAGGQRAQPRKHGRTPLTSRVNGASGRR